MTRNFIPFVLVFLCVLSSFPSRAEKAPDLLSVGGGAYNFDKERDNRKSFDYRIEYRWGVSLLPKFSDVFNKIDPYVQLHPALGFEGNTHGATYPNGGLNLDVPFLHYGIFTLSESIGAFWQGNDVRPMGSVLQFRSQAELGFRFDNNIRITGFISHISNANVADCDPGAEIAGVYVHLPLSLLKKK